MNTVNVAILGTGNIGTDLLFKVLKSEYLNCTLFVGRNLDSPNIKLARELGVEVSAKGIDELVDSKDKYDIVFDATSAADHMIHAGIFAKLNKYVIDMTPAKVGEMCIPAVNLDIALQKNNVNMVTCGGQASIPLAYALGQAHDEIEYIEVISTIASKSAGAATRRNLDEYIETTEKGIIQFSGAKRAKAILNLNPIEPCVNMQTTVIAKVSNPNINGLNEKLKGIMSFITGYIPGYEVIVPPTLKEGTIVMIVKVIGSGDYLPKYAGNLDIINCAGIIIAEEFAKKCIG